MEASVILILGVTLIVLIAAIIIARQLWGVPNSTESHTATHWPSLNPEQLAEIQRDIAANNNIVAIKKVRDWTGLGLAEAKEAVDFISKGGHLANELPEQAKPNPPIQDEQLLNTLKSLVESGQKIQAVKVYRDATGVGLKEAKEFVDQL